MNRPESPVPLAWLNLRHDRRRLATALAGVGFAVVLMFMELGFLTALLDSTVAPLDLLDDRSADLVMISDKKETLTDRQRLPRRWLVVAEADPNVAAARPLFFERALSDWYNPATRRSQRIRVMASDSEAPVFRLPGGVPLYERLKQLRTALFDEKSKRSFDFDLLRRATPTGLAVEAVLARKAIDVIDTFSMGTDFANDGNILVGARTFDALFPSRRIHDDDHATVDVGLIRLSPHVDSATVREDLERRLPPEVCRVRILTLPELKSKERLFWLQHTPIGFIFILGVILGFVVGVVICFQILSSEIRNHLGEYATLKAMGYDNPFLKSVVSEQALWLAVLGFLPGILFSYALYVLLEALTGLPLRLEATRVGVVFVLTVFMCIVSAYFAVRKLLSVDPAELF